MQKKNHKLCKRRIINWCNIWWTWSVRLTLAPAAMSLVSASVLPFSAVRWTGVLSFWIQRTEVKYCSKDSVKFKRLGENYNEMIEQRAVPKFTCSTQMQIIQTLNTKKNDKRLKHSICYCKTASATSRSARAAMSAVSASVFRKYAARWAGPLPSWIQRRERWTTAQSGRHISAASRRVYNGMSTDILIPWNNIQWTKHKKKWRFHEICIVRPNPCNWYRRAHQWAQTVHLYFHFLQLHEQASFYPEYRKQKWTTAQSRRYERTAARIWY